MKDIRDKIKAMREAKLKSYGHKGPVRDHAGEYKASGGRIKRAHGGRIHKDLGGSLMDGPLDGAPSKQNQARAPRGTTIIMNFPQQGANPPAGPSPMAAQGAAVAGGPPPPMAGPPPPMPPPGMGMPPPPMGAPGMMPPPPPMRAHGGRVHKAPGGALMGGGNPWARWWSQHHHPMSGMLAPSSAGPSPTSVNFQSPSGASASMPVRPMMPIGGMDVYHGPPPAPPVGGYPPSNGPLSFPNLGNAGGPPTPGATNPNPISLPPGPITSPGPGMPQPPRVPITSPGPNTIPMDPGPVNGRPEGGILGGGPIGPPVTGTPPPQQPPVAIPQLPPAPPSANGFGPGGGGTGTPIPAGGIVQGPNGFPIGMGGTASAAAPRPMGMGMGAPAARGGRAHKAFGGPLAGMPGGPRKLPPAVAAGLPHHASMAPAAVPAAPMMPRGLPGVPSMKVPLSVTRAQGGFDVPHYGIEMPTGLEHQSPATDDDRIRVQHDGYDNNPNSRAHRPYGGKYNVEHQVVPMGRARGGATNHHDEGHVKLDAGAVSGPGRLEQRNAHRRGRK